MVTVYADLALMQAQSGEIAAGVVLYHHGPDGPADYCVISAYYDATLPDGKKRSVKQTLPTLISAIIRYSGPGAQKIALFHRLPHLLYHRQIMDNVITQGVIVTFTETPRRKMTYARLLLEDAARRKDTVIQPVGGYNV